MAQILEKRTYDAVKYDFLCSSLLATGEVVTTVASVASDQSVGYAFGTPQINGSPITYSDGTVAAAGQVIQVEISAGAIPAGADSMKLGVPNFLTVVRAKFTTNQSPNQLDATGYLLLKDTP